MRHCLTLLILLFAAPSWALTFGVGCADPCGREEIVLGGTAVCTAVLAVDGLPFSVQPSSTVTVSDADGADVLPVVSAPVEVPAFASAAFPVTITTDLLDRPGDSIAVQFLLHSLVPGFPQPIDEQFGSRLTAIPTQTCFQTTTTLATTTTVTTTSTTTTTVQTVLGHRLGVCAHNGMPKKCD